MNGEQATLTLEEPSPLEPESFLLGYRRQITAATKDVGMARSRETDPDGLAVVLDAIAELAAEGRWFTSDDVRALVGPGFSGVMGAGFNSARRRHIIEPVGVETSKVVTTHGRLIRTWVGVSP